MPFSDPKSGMKHTEYVWGHFFDDLCGYEKKHGFDTNLKSRKTWKKKTYLARQVISIVVLKSLLWPKGTRKK